MGVIGKSESNEISNIGILSSASKDVFNKFIYQCIHIINIKERLNIHKGRKKIQEIELLFKYHWCIYNDKNHSDINHKGQQTVPIIKCYEHKTTSIWKQGYSKISSLLSRSKIRADNFCN